MLLLKRYYFRKAVLSLLSPMYKCSYTPPQCTHLAMNFEVSGILHSYTHPHFKIVLPQRKSTLARIGGLFDLVLKVHNYMNVRLYKLLLVLNFEFSTQILKWFWNTLLLHIAPIYAWIRNEQSCMHCILKNKCAKFFKLLDIVLAIPIKLVSL